MKIKSTIAVISALALSTSCIPAYAEDVAGWALLDANNNVLSVEVCTMSVCGDPNSEFSKLRLQPGQRYVLQTQADPETGNVAGYGGPGVSYIPEIDSFAQVSVYYDSEINEVVSNLLVIPSGTIPGQVNPAITDTVARADAIAETVKLSKIQKKVVKPQKKAKKKAKKK